MIEIPNSIQRVCECCGSPLAGRIDKKFCNDYCRNLFNNQRKAKDNNSTLVNEINKALLRNRKVLQSVLQDKQELRINGAELTKRGFQFEFVTQVSAGAMGAFRLHCYDYSYTLIGEDDYLLCRTQVSS